MEKLALQFFPFPYVFRGERAEGLRIKWPSRCVSCRDRQCERATSNELELCSYGVNYVRVDNDLLVAGIVLKDFPEMTSARRKMIRRVGKATVSQSEVNEAVEAARASVHQLAAELRGKKDAIISEYRDSREYQQEIVELLRPEVQQALGQVHDYKQFVQQIIQNINVILETKFPGIPLEEQLESASHEEAAIYWAARLMEEKLDAALYLMYPDRINDLRERRRFRFHGAVTKYRKIYQRRLDSRHLKIILEGESHAQVEGNPRAIPIIAHALIDNAIKYAPEGTSITLGFRETSEWIDFSVQSYGPPILSGERARIFDLFYRGEIARQRDSEGTGFGLASAQNIAKAVGTEISVEQGNEAGPDDTRLTIFAARIDTAPPRDSPPPPRGRRS